MRATTAATHAHSGPPVGTELEVRRSVWRLLARELSEPSEELVRFVCARVDDGGHVDGSCTELVRRALQEFAGTRWTAGERHGPRASGRGRKRAAEAGSLPGYYLG